MSLNKEKLKEDIKSLFSDLSKIESQEESIDIFSSKLASIIDSYIRTAEVTVKPGIQVGTSGGAGATTSTGSGTIS